MLRLEQVEHYYQGRRVLAVPELALEPGSVLAVVGPNGAGKSTLLRILALLEAPTRGTVSFLGRPLTSRRARRQARQRITLVEQRPWLFGGRVMDNLLYALALHRVRGAAAVARAQAALERLGIADLAGREARSLSAGQGHQVALARALVLEPQILLLDEPTSSADPAYAARLYQVLGEERSRGLALCFASHQLEDAYRWSDRLLALAEGCPSPVTPENLFRVHLPQGTGPRLVEAGPLQLQVVTDRVGPAIVALPPEDIVVSTEPLHSSARNQFAGRVRRISDDGGGRLTLTVDVGVDLAVRITARSLADLGLGVGSPVVLSIKATAVRVF